MNPPPPLRLFSRQKVRAVFQIREKLLMCITDARDFTIYIFRGVALFGSREMTWFVTGCSSHDEKLNHPGTVLAQKQQPRPWDDSFRQKRYNSIVEMSPPPPQRLFSLQIKVHAVFQIREYIVDVYNRRAWLYDICFRGCSTFRV